MAQGLVELWHIYPGRLAALSVGETEYAMQPLLLPAGGGGRTIRYQYGISG